MTVGKAVKEFFSGVLRSVREARKSGEKVSWKEKRKEIEEYQKKVAGEAAFEKMFGASFDVLFLDAMARHLARLLPQALPPILWQLAQGDSAVAESDTPFVACLHKVGAYWGDAPEGGGGGGNYAFHATLAYDAEHDRYTIAYNGGTAAIHGGEHKTFEGGERSGRSNLYVSLNYDPSKSAGSRWSMHFGNSYPKSDGGKIMVPLFYFEYAEDGGGQLVQETEGAVYVHAIRNVVDTDDAEEAEEEGATP